MNRDPISAEAFGKGGKRRGGAPPFFRKAFPLPSAILPRLGEVRGFGMSDEIRISGIVEESIVDGPGLALRPVYAGLPAPLQGLP